MDDQNAEATTALSLVETVAGEYDAEIYVYSAPIDHKGYSKLVGCYNPHGRQNALLILTTNGGLANSAYKIARFFQTQYESFQVVIPSVCKSAGTLLACGAHRLVMTPFSELGPLDVQLYARDEIGARKSGLLNHSAFEALKSEAFELYEHFMLSIKHRSGDNISFPLASDVAAEMAARMMSPIFEQVSPDALGSDYRDLQVAVEYGERLGNFAGNIKPWQIDYLTNHYPSHDFIIDKWEAMDLFENVDGPSPALWDLISALSSVVFSEQREGAVHCLTNFDTEDDENEDRDEHDTESPTMGEEPARDSGGDSSESAQGRTERRTRKAED